MIVFIFLLFSTHCLAVPIRDWAELNFTDVKDESVSGGTKDLCVKGVRQSPVDLNAYKTQKNTPLIFKGYATTRYEGFTLQNTGHSAQIEFTGTAPTLTGGPLNGYYTLSQLHFHWGTANEGSEHSIDGQFYALEGHFVHYKTSYGSVAAAALKPDGLAVVGLMFQLTRKNNTKLSPIITGLSNIHTEFATTNLKPTAMNWLYSLKHFEYYTYSGSLTTPPCAESVTWIVSKKKSTISSEQITEFRKLEAQGVKILENRRAIQLINGRTITCAK